MSSGQELQDQQVNHNPLIFLVFTFLYFGISHMNLFWQNSIKCSRKANRRLPGSLTWLESIVLSDEGMRLVESTCSLGKLGKSDFQPHEERVLTSRFDTKWLAVVIQAKLDSVDNAEQVLDKKSGESLLAIKSAIFKVNCKLYLLCSVVEIGYKHIARVGRDKRASR